MSQRVRGRALHLIHGEDAYRARLRAAELVASLASGDARPSDLRAQRSADLGAQLGLSRHDARTADASVIELSGRSQGLFDAVDELRIVVVEHAEALRDTSVIARFPAEAALVLVSEAKIATRARRAAKPKSAKLGAFAAGQRVTGADVRALVSGAIETDVFDLTQAVVRHDSQTAVARLEALLAEGQAAQQILALLLWQFRVLLFASAMKTNADAERMAKAIRSSAYAIGKWQAFARRVARADIIRAYEVLYATDLAIKTGRTEPEMAMLLCVLDLCGIHAADPRELVVGEPPRR